MKKNMRTLLVLVLGIVLFALSLTACGPTSRIETTEGTMDVFDEVLIEEDGVMFGYAHNDEMGGYDLISYDKESKKATVHGNTNGYIIYDRTLVFGPSIVIDGIAYVTTYSTERENEDLSFAVKGVDLFSFGKDKLLDYGRLFQENVTVNKLEEKDGNLVVHIEDAEELFNIKDV
ncbi:MAG: hypothetical protein E7564_10585 [Ruminococcaceae bacterium]|nr:hypothetical protein [Oscillospiraceae bacterium]